jgi:dephospho-CoA kinase
VETATLSGCCTNPCVRLLKKPRPPCRTSLSAFADQEYDSVHAAPASLRARTHADRRAATPLDGAVPAGKDSLRAGERCAHAVDRGNPPKRLRSGFVPPLSGAAISGAPAEEDGGESRLIVLTGGIASGKSTFARAYAAAGGAVVEADEVTRALTRPGGALRRDFLALVGPAFRTPDGDVDRGALRRALFADPGLRRRLETLLHPAVRREILRRAALLAPPVLVVVPLYAEIEPRPFSPRRVVVVDCPPTVQIARLAARDGYDAPDARRALAAQASRSARIALADDLVFGDAPRDDVARAARRLLARHRRIFSQP